MLYEVEPATNTSSTHFMTIQGLVDFILGFFIDYTYQQQKYLTNNQKTI